MSVIVTVGGAGKSAAWAKLGSLLRFESHFKSYFGNATVKAFTRNLNLKKKNQPDSKVNPECHPKRKVNWSGLLSALDCLHSQKRESYDSLFCK